jgi:hypothetical protein
MPSKGVRERPGWPDGRDRGSCHHEENVKDLLREVQDEVNQRVVSLNYYVMPKSEDLNVDLESGR